MPNRLSHDPSTESSTMSRICPSSFTLLMAASKVLQSCSTATHEFGVRCCRACSLKSEDWSWHFGDTELFQHPPLDTSRGSIRLLDILPPQRDGIVRCKLKAALLPSPQNQGSHVSYQAVSYTWGRRYAHKWILVNDQRFLVRENLWRLLNELAKSDLACGGNLPNLWIDALCIAQHDTTEKNHQVQLMKTIFAMAQCVIVWPGVTSELADNLHDLRDAVAPIPNSSTRVPHSSSRVLAAHKAIETACNAPYWSRLWILQEVGVAQRIVLLLGQRTMSWKDWTMTLQRFLVESDRPTTVRGSRLPGVNVTFWQPELKITSSLANLIVRFRDMQCADHRDRIYGLLGFVEDGDKFTVDYNENPQHLLRRTTRHFRPPNIISFAFELRCALDISSPMPETELFDLKCVPPEIARVTPHPMYANSLASLLPNCHRPPPSDRRSCWRTSLFQEVGYISICRCLDCRHEPSLRDIQHAFLPGSCTSFILVELLNVRVPCRLLFRRTWTASRKHSFELLATALSIRLDDDFSEMVLIHSCRRPLQAQAQLSWCEGDQGGLGDVFISPSYLSTILWDRLTHCVTQRTQLWSRFGGILHSDGSNRRARKRQRRFITSVPK